MGWFSNVTHWFGKAGHSIAHFATEIGSTIHHAPVIGKAIDATVAVGSSIFDTTKVVAQTVPRIIGGAGNAVVSIEKGVEKEAPKVLGAVSNTIQGIGNVSEYLPFIALGLGAVYLIKH